MRRLFQGSGKVFFQHCRELFSLFVIILLLIAPTSIVSAEDLPKPQGYVNDFANVIDDGSRVELTRILKDLEKTTSAEVVVATVKSSAPLDPFTYRVKLFKEWGIGKKKEKNGMLLIFFQDERRTEIEIGYGLESIVTDSIAGEIIRKQIRPYFKQQNYGEGFLRAVKVIAHKIKQESTAKPEKSKSKGISALTLLLILGGFIALIYFWTVYSYKTVCIQCNSRRHVKRTQNQLVTNATFFSEGLRQVTNFCKKCNVSWTTNESIPRKRGDDIFWGGGFGGGMGGFGGGSSGSSDSFGGFGGGDSGGGGAGGDT